MTYCHRCGDATPPELLDRSHLCADCAIRIESAKRAYQAACDDKRKTRYNAAKSRIEVIGD